MPIYIAMLRGINVGGQRIIRMEHLRASLGALGFRAVQTYAQSGNVIFRAAKASPVGLAKRLREGLLRDLGFSVSVVLRTSDEMQDVAGANPFLKQQGIDHAKLHVTFLSASPAKTALGHLETLNTEPDQLRIAGREIYLHCPDGYGRTKLSNNAFERWLSVEATTRNWKTVKMLCALSSK